MITIERKDFDDKIKAFQTRSYKSAVQSCYRVYEFKMFQSYPTVTHLLLHFPREQTYTYKTDEFSVRESLKQNKITLLTAYFEANMIYPSKAPQYLYKNLPSKYTWDEQAKMWLLRDLSNILLQLQLLDV